MPPLGRAGGDHAPQQVEVALVDEVGGDVGAQAEAVLRLPVGERDRAARIALRVAILDRAEGAVVQAGAEPGVDALVGEVVVGARVDVGAGAVARADHLAADVAVGAIGDHPDELRTGVGDGVRELDRHAGDVARRVGRGRHVERRGVAFALHVELERGANRHRGADLVVAEAVDVHRSADRRAVGERAAARSRRCGCRRSRSRGRRLRPRPAPRGRTGEGSGRRSAPGRGCERRPRSSATKLRQSWSGVPFCAVQRTV